MVGSLVLSLTPVIWPHALVVAHLKGIEKSRYVDISKVGLLAERGKEIWRSVKRLTHRKEREQERQITIHYSKNVGSFVKASRVRSIRNVGEKSKAGVSGITIVSSSQIGWMDPTVYSGS